MFRLRISVCADLLIPADLRSEIGRDAPTDEGGGLQQALKKKKKTPVAGRWCIDQMVRLIGKTCLQRHFCKMTLLWMFHHTFKVNVQ